MKLTKLINDRVSNGSAAGLPTSDYIAMNPNVAHVSNDIIFSRHATGHYDDTPGWWPIYWYTSILGGAFQETSKTVNRAAMTTTPIAKALVIIYSQREIPRFPSTCVRCFMCFIFGPCTLTGSRTKHTKRLTQVDGNPGIS